ncbi:uncharacterized protein DS421_2g41110 [Arachis hypogaea]|nr:uncharacterized protein DS421_2g41110 [Arachis hypogaea]
MDEFFEHTHTRKEDMTQWVDKHSQKTKATIEAGVTDPLPVSEESIWIETVGGKRKDRVYGMGEMDQFSHQLSSLTEYVKVMGPSSSRLRIIPPPPFTFPSSQKSTAPALVPTPATGRKLPPILQRPGQP